MPYEKELPARDQDYNLKMTQAFLLVMAGGAFGSAARYLISHVFSDASKHSGFPIGTLVVNVAGSLLVGYILTWSTDDADGRLRLLAATGFCGGFTTFSTFSYETMAYWQDGRVLLFGLNILLHNTLSLLAVLVGISLGNSR